MNARASCGRKLLRFVSFRTNLVLYFANSMTYSGALAYVMLLLTSHTLASLHSVITSTWKSG